MIFFFQSSSEKIYGLESQITLPSDSILKLNWLFGAAKLLDKENLEGEYIGPR